MTRYFLFIPLIIISLTTCRQTGKSPGKAEARIDVPVFSADSAYTYTSEQVAFGPRVPNTQSHRDCGYFLVSKMKSFGATVYEQNVNLKTYDGIELKAKNIIGSFQPENKNRILLFAHWDTRPFSDQDPNPENYKKPIDGANDGAGACAVLLEIARQIGLKQPSIGVDIIFFDAEDWGVPSFDKEYQGFGGYCLGSDFWAQNPHEKNYTARYGILLDMVSAPGARFYKEYYSKQAAPGIIGKVWEAAQINGFGQFFIDDNGGSVEDDHVHVMKYRTIPCINIIHYDPETEHNFGSYWHTQKDNMENISKETLQAVGQTLLYVIYHEK
ncbi:MAG: M28 family peptidase [Dysgonamonadaceae bacterium]|jgi:hypothetical protein|nr:M28 family peptidase [Dysgonamonadaceae bacterium]